MPSTNDVFRAAQRFWLRFTWCMFCVLLTQEFLGTETSLAVGVRLGVVGDSMSAGDGSDFGSYPNWVTQVSKSKAFVVGPNGNLAVGGAVSTDVIDEQLPILQSQIEAGGLDYTVLMIGANDVAFTALNYLETGDLAGTIQELTNTVVPNIENTLAAIASTGSVRQILVNIPDQTVSPLVKQLFAEYHATPAQIQEVRSGVQAINAQIQSYALAHGIPVVDMFSASDYLVAHTPLKLAGVSFPNLFASDGYHPGAVSQGLIGNAIITAANLRYGAGITPISDQQIVRNAGKTPSKLTPTHFDMAPFVILPVPEPSTFVLAATAMVGLVVHMSRRRAHGK